MGKRGQDYPRLFDLNTNRLTPLVQDPWRLPQKKPFWLGNCFLVDDVALKKGKHFVASCSSLYHLDPERICRTRFRISGHFVAHYTIVLQIFGSLNLFPRMQGLFVTPSRAEFGFSHGVLLLLSSGERPTAFFCYCAQKKTRRCCVILSESFFFAGKEITRKPGSISAQISMLLGNTPSVKIKTDTVD